MENATLLWRIIEIVVFLLPIGGLVWKAAKQSTRIDDMKKQIDALEQRISLNEKQSQKDISDIKNSIAQININNAEILTSLSFIKEQISELKGTKN